MSRTSGASDIALLGVLAVEEILDHIEVSPEIVDRAVVERYDGGQIILRLIGHRLQHGETEIPCLAGEVEDEAAQVGQAIALRQALDQIGGAFQGFADELGQQSRHHIRRGARIGASAKATHVHSYFRLRKFRLRKDGQFGRRFVKKACMAPRLERREVGDLAGDDVDRLAVRGKRQEGGFEMIVSPVRSPEGAAFGIGWAAVSRARSKPIRAASSLTGGINREGRSRTRCRSLPRPPDRRGFGTAV
jgi:hypothetical protein